MLLLAGDIGGTKTHLALFSLESGPHTVLAEATFPSVDYPSLEAIITIFLSRLNRSVTRACFGVAGPVVNGRAQLTNLPWLVDRAQLQQALNLSDVRLINDLAAIANAVPFLKADDLETLKAGQAVHGGAIAVIAPGTGLGEAFLTWDGARYQAHMSEGGHTDFGPLDPLQADLLRYLQQKLDHVSYEQVCSGMGLPNVYDYLRDSAYAEEPAWLAEKLAAARDRTPVIVQTAIAEDQSCRLCQATLELFVSILGAEAGNLALKVLATGGVYLGGGIPPRILPALRQPGFTQAFCSKGRFVNLMSQMPIQVILHPQAALLGVACHGLDWSGHA